MSLKTALLQVKQSKAEQEITRKIEQMIAQQKALLDTALDINKDGDIVKVKKEWQPDILTKGGVSYYKLNDKWYRVSVRDGDNDVILKFKIKTALDKTLSVSAKSNKEAQSVVDDIFGKSKYIVSACCL